MGTALVTPGQRAGETTGESQPRQRFNWSRLRYRIHRSQLSLHIVMLAVAFVILVPLLWIIGSSFKDRVEYATNTAGLIPHHWSLVNWRYMFTSMALLPTYMTNSILLAGSAAVLDVALASLAGYAFARLQFRGKNAIFLVFVLSIFIPRNGGLMALYEMMAFLHLRNSIFGLVLLFGAASLPVLVFIMRQTYLAIPKEIEEAAVVDGAGWFRVFWRIVFPLGMPGMAIVGVLAFVGVWSDYLVTYTMIDQDSQMTISVGVQKLLVTSYQQSLTPGFQGLFTSQAVNATILLFAALPVLVVYTVLQRWFMRGLMYGAVGLKV